MGKKQGGIKKEKGKSFYGDSYVNQGNGNLARFIIGDPLVSFISAGSDL
jgi:hypothetical protein